MRRAEIPYRRLAPILLGCAAMLVAACSSSSETGGETVTEARGGASDTASVGIPWVFPPVPTPTHGVGNVTVQFENTTNEEVNISYGVENNDHCETNKWYWGNDTKGRTSGVFPPLDPGQKGGVLMHSSMCGGLEGNIPPENSEGAHSVGVDGQAQFQFAQHFNDLDGNFDHFTWAGDYSASGSTGGLFMVDCDDSDEYLGTGEEGINSGAHYSDHDTACFEYRGAPPQLAEGQSCEAPADEVAQCQLDYDFGEVNDNINVTFTNQSDDTAEVSYVGLHGDADTETIEGGESATIGLGAGHFGTLTVESQGSDSVTVSVTSMSSA